MTAIWYRWRCELCGKEGAARGENETEILEQLHRNKYHPELESENENVPAV